MTKITRKDGQSVRGSVQVQKNIFRPEPEPESKFRFRHSPNLEPELRVQFSSVRVRTESLNRTVPPLEGDDEVGICNAMSVILVVSGRRSAFTCLFKRQWWWGSQEKAVREIGFKQSPYLPLWTQVDHLTVDNRFGRIVIVLLNWGSFFSEALHFRIGRSRKMEKKKHSGEPYA
ncbi:hypothetical protein B0H12DRAFT_580202 [Mycena haematopus]|nr:hypothetical protein B0H12DRAFT_580202 [Mycena haematopus]